MFEFVFHVFCIGIVCKEHWTQFSNRISGSSLADDEVEIQNVSEPERDLNRGIYSHGNSTSSLLTDFLSMFEYKNPEKSCVVLSRCRMLFTLSDNPGT